VEDEIKPQREEFQKQWSSKYRQAPYGKEFLQDTTSDDVIGRIGYTCQ